LSLIIVLIIIYFCRIIKTVYKYYIKIKNNKITIYQFYENIKGDWGLGDWGLGTIPNPQSPIPNPQLLL